ncbi:MAG TPA: hypothetical protein DHR80_04010 [Thalassospira lucentensis]|uniref:Uncharacterized protein n=1 Tax=Thalassospira lucentensis TaxID=168935 RepID=A0A3D5N4M4_9PROT|nr:hypothetical protein [Thalassospira lucentensis]
MNRFRPLGEERAATIHHYEKSRELYDMSWKKKVGATGAENMLKKRAQKKGDSPLFRGLG